MKKRVAVIGCVGIPAIYGGFETLVENLLDLDDIDFTVYCEKKKYTDRTPIYKGAKRIFLPLSANGLASLIYDALSAIHASKKNDTLLFLGLSGAWIIPFLRIFFKPKIIVNVDGFEWKREKFPPIMRLVIKFFEKIAVRFSHEIVGDNETIINYIKKEYGVNSTYIAYGGEHAISKKPIQPPFKNYAFCVSRIEPENNVDLVLEAFTKNTKTMVYIGNWKNSEYGRSLLEKYKSYTNIHLLDPIYDLDILGGYRQNCDIYVHGHSAGGTNPSLVEIMHYGRCILTYDCSFNKNTTRGDAIYFESSLDLATKISKLEKSQIATIEKKMKYHANNDFTWIKVNQSYLGLF